MEVGRAVNIEGDTSNMLLLERGRSSFSSKSLDRAAFSLVGVSISVQRRGRGIGGRDRYYTQRAVDTTTHEMPNADRAKASLDEAKGTIYKIKTKSWLAREPKQLKNQRVGDGMPAPNK